MKRSARWVFLQIWKRTGKILMVRLSSVKVMDDSGKQDNKKIVYF